MAKVIFCGTLGKEEKNSWDKTNGFFFRALSSQATCYHLDYSPENAVIKKAHKILSGIIYGETLVRDPIYDFLLEHKFKKYYNKLCLTPDLIIHSSTVCVPCGYEKKCPHVLYTDASIMGGVRYNNLNPSAKAMALFTKETKKYIDRLKLVFSFNEWTRRSLIEDFNIEEKKVVNVGFGANLNPYQGPKDYSNKEILIVLRRGLEKNKGLLLLLEAFKEAFKKDPAIKLSVVGTTLEKIEGVTYYEGYPREKTIELFQQASLFAMPALFEPNGMVYIEALACKTPILGLNRLAFPEFSGYGKYGFIVDENRDNIAQVILEALNKPELLRTMGEEGQIYVSGRFDWDIVIKKILQTSILTAI